jgi:hypothetical protein
MLKLNEHTTPARGCIPNKQVSKGKTSEITATVSIKETVDFANDTTGYI